MLRAVVRCWVVCEDDPLHSWTWCFIFMEINHVHTICSTYSAMYQRNGRIPNYGRPSSASEKTDSIITGNLFYGRSLADFLSIHERKTNRCNDTTRRFVQIYNSYATHSLEWEWHVSIHWISYPHKGWWFMEKNERALRDIFNSFCFSSMWRFGLTVASIAFQPFVNLN